MAGAEPNLQPRPAGPKRPSWRRFFARFKEAQGPPPGPPLLGAKAALVKVLGSCFGAGYLPLAPGTWGSLVAFAAWLVGRQLAANANLRPGLVDMVCFLLSVVFALATLGLGTLAERAAGRLDPQWFVLDELAGAFLALYGLAGYNLWAAAGAFLLFRLLDATKLGLIGRAERWLRGGMGILMDDIFAGAAANLIVRGVIGAASLATR